MLGANHFGPVLTKSFPVKTKQESSTYVWREKRDSRAVWSEKSMFPTWHGHIFKLQFSGKK
jgi:hypothetical protein